MIFLLALLMGVIAGLRAFLPLAAVSWAAYLGWLPIADSLLAFLGYRWTPWILTALALIELVTDQLPSTPSRTVPMQFGTRLATAAISGAAIGAPFGLLIIGLIAGIIGAVIGTLGGRAVRTKLADSLRSDTPAALIEDAVAIMAAILIIMALR